MSIDERLLAQRDFLIAELARLHQNGPRYRNSWRWDTGPRGTSSEYKKGFKQAREDVVRQMLRVLEHEITEIIANALKVGVSKNTS